MVKKKYKNLSIYLALVFVFMASAQKIEGEKIVVPDDYPTIQEAVDAAMPYDTVVVMEGTYYEHVFVGKPLTLLGNGAAINGWEGGYYEPMGPPLLIVSSSHVRIENLHLVYGCPAMVVGGGSDILIRRVSFSDNYGGLRLDGASEPIVVQECSLIWNEGSAITISGSDGVTVRDCSIHSGLDFGIYLNRVQTFEVTGNRIEGFSTCGLRLENCVDGLIERNEIVNNCGAFEFWTEVLDVIIRENIIRKSWFGISPYHLDNADIEIYHNDFLDIIFQVEYPLLNPQFVAWDDGYPSGGNYWSDYIGIDSDGDGIGDIPHWMRDDAKDIYPLIKPYQYGIAADVHIVPRSLNEKSSGRWITAFIELPESLDVNDIDISTVLLNKTIRCETHPCTIGDYNLNGIPDLMVKFQRTALAELLKQKELREECELKVTGDVNGQQFVGFCPIRFKQ